MEGITLTYIVALVESSIMIFMSVFYIVHLSDLESKLMEVSACCKRLNKVVIPEAVIVALPTVFFLFNGCFGSLALSVPMMAWILYRIATRPQSNISYYDPAEILNGSLLRKYIYESVSKLVYHLVAFFIFLFTMITYLVDEDNGIPDGPPIMPHGAF